MGKGETLLKIIQLVRRIKIPKERLSGIILIILGVALGVVSKTFGDSAFQDFTSGVSLGLSVGILISGIVMILLSFCKKGKRETESTKETH